MKHTEGNAWVFVSDALTVLVGEEHVSRETTLGGVGVCIARLAVIRCRVSVGDQLTLLSLALSTTALGGLACSLFLRHVGYWLRKTVSFVGGRYGV